MDTPEADRNRALPHPRETYDLVGHAEAEHALARAYAEERMPTAWLIGGPPGVGKATLAYRFARVLLAGKPIDPEARTPLACSRDDAVSRLIEAQAHPDFLVLRKPWDEKAKRFKQSLPVDEVRRIHSLFASHAGQDGYRVCLVDTADDLNPQAANALLKTVEEPPRRAVFLLLAHAPQRLLPTIRSRTRRLMLKPLGEPELGTVLAQHNVQLPPDARSTLMRLAGGSPGRALALAAEGGLELYETLLALLGDLPRLDAVRLHDFAERLARPAEEQAYEGATALLSGLLSRLVRAGAGYPVEMASSAEAALAARLEPGANLERWLDVWDNVRRLVARAEALGLDRRQALLGAFGALETAAGATAR